jgi:hypothetical protein
LPVTPHSAGSSTEKIIFLIGMGRQIRSLAKVQKVPLFPLLGGVGVGGDLGGSNRTYARGLMLKLKKVED